MFVLFDFLAIFDLLSGMEESEVSVEFKSLGFALSCLWLKPWKRKAPAPHCQEQPQSPVTRHTCLNIATNFDVNLRQSSISITSGHKKHY